MALTDKNNRCGSGIIRYYKFSFISKQRYLKFKNHQNWKKKKKTRKVLFCSEVGEWEERTRRAGVGCWWSEEWCRSCVLHLTKETVYNLICRRNWKEIIATYYEREISWNPPLFNGGGISLSLLPPPSLLPSLLQQQLLQFLLLPFPSIYSCCCRWIREILP